MTHSATIQIRPWQATDSLAALTDLLHRAYKPLADAGMRFVASHQDDRTTLKRLSKGACYLAHLDGKLIGTIVYYPPGTDHECWWYEQPGVAFFGQFAVEPDQQRTGVGTLLLIHAEQLAIADAAREIALDTSEHAAELIAWYTKRGYRHVGHTQWDSTNYRSVILSKCLVKQKT